MGKMLVRWLGCLVVRWLGCLVVGWLVVGCAMETDGGRAQYPTPTRILTYTPLATPTLFAAAIEATSTAQARTQSAVEIEKQQSTRNAQATVSAGGIGATLTVQAAGANAAATMLAIAPAQTQAAATSTAAVATQNRGATGTAFAPLATQTQAAIDESNRLIIISGVWELLKVVSVVALVVCVCIVILWVGKAHKHKIEADNLQKTWSIMTIGATPYRLQWNFERQEWDFSPLVIENPRQLDSGASERLKLEAASLELAGRWQEAILLAAQAASITGTWSVSVMSNRKAALGVMSEDALKDITDILVGEGWLLRDASGTRWVEGRGGFLGLRAAMKAGEFRFTPPLSADGTPKQAPAISLDNATQRPQRGQRAAKPAMV